MSQNEKVVEEVYGPMSKAAGVDRPYTAEEFIDLMSGSKEGKAIIDKAGLDYFIAPHGSQTKELLYDDREIFTITRFGGCEGAYTEFYFGKAYDEPEFYFAVAKTLDGGYTGFRAMSEFACEMKLQMDGYIAAHSEEFNWSGYDIGVIHEGKIHYIEWCFEEDWALISAAGLVAKDRQVIIRNNRTREEKQYTGKEK